MTDPETVERIARGLWAYRITLGGCMLLVLYCAHIADERANRTENYAKECALAHLTERKP